MLSSCAYLFVSFAKIISEDVDFKRLRTEVGGWRNLVKSFQNPKQKKGGSGSSNGSTSGPTLTTDAAFDGTTSSIPTTGTNPSAGASLGPTPCSRDPWGNQLRSVLWWLAESNQSD